MVFEWPDPGHILGGPNPKNCSFSRKVGQKSAKIGQNRGPELARGQKTLTQARTGPKTQAQNPTRTMKKVSRPSPREIESITRTQLLEETKCPYLR